MAQPMPGKGFTPKQLPDLAPQTVRGRSLVCSLVLRKSLITAVVPAIKPATCVQRKDMQMMLRGKPLWLIVFAVLLVGVGVAAASLGGFGQVQAWLAPSPAGELRAH